MKNRTALLVASVCLAACGGGGGGNSTGSTTPPVTTPPVVVTPPVVTPPVVTPPTVAACAAPTTVPAQVLFNGAPMLALCDNVYVEPTATADEQLSLRQSVALAYATVTDFYTTFTAPHPRMILCQTQACRTYFMGTSYASLYSPLGLQIVGAQYTSGVPTVFVTYTSFPNLGRQTLAHELTHTETIYRYGQGSVPDWFNEGTATMVGGYPDCTGQTTSPIPDLSTSDVNNEFTVMAADSSKGTAVYCQAAREVQAWVALNGKPKFYSLLSGVKAGQQFSALYGPLINH